MLPPESLLPPLQRYPLQHLGISFTISHPPAGPRALYLLMCGHVTA